MTGEKKVKKQINILSVLLLSAVIALNLLPAGAGAVEPFEIDEHLAAEGFYTMKDLETEEKIMVTARMVHVDDQYINMKNKLYRVERIEGNIAWARFIENVELAQSPSREVLMKYSGIGLVEEGQPQNGGQIIGVYHSHGAEAYVPSDGAESIDEGGGILEVGRSFVSAMEQRGFTVLHSLETHVPHDAGAYQRSRRTAEELIRDGVIAIFDVHRDAVPAQEYTEVVNNEETVQIQFVVGRQNQNIQANREFAESLKSVTDETYPGLIKGIFMARGNYNQDMMPLAILLEVGSHENTREGAERSVELFADAVSTYFGAEGAGAREGVGLTALRSILWVILIAAVAVGVYLLIGTGSTEELRNKIRHFFKKEFAEFGRKQKGGEDEGK